MPDILGPLYEAVLAHCLQSRGESATGGPRPLFIKDSTGQDGNEGHKWNELAGRVRAHQVIAGDVDVWPVLDGEWSKDAVRKLHEAGYARVFGVDEIAELARDLSEWVRG